MSGTTSLSELPNKVTLETKEIVGKRQAPQILSPKEVEEMVNHLEDGGTALPSRDVPVNVQHIRPDPQARAEYIPPPLRQQVAQRAAQRVQEVDYIKEHDTVENAIKKNEEKEVKQNSLDVLYDEIQTPLFVMLLFFVFQMPFFQKMMIRYLPSLFSKDGHPTFGGFIVKTLLFGVSFYSMNKAIFFLSEI